VISQFLRPPRRQRPGRRSALAAISSVTVSLLVVGGLVGSARAYAADTPVALGQAASFSVFGATGVASTGATALSGDVGVGPTGAISGFPPGTIGGATHAGDATAAQAQSDLNTAYADAAARSPATAFSGDLNGRTFDAGVYDTSAALALTGTVTLDAQGDPGAVFVFQVGAALNTAANSTVALINGAQASNVFWQVAGAAGTGASSSFSGTILASGAVTIGANAELVGRALSDGTVTLATNAVESPAASLPLTAGLAGPVTFPTVDASHSPVAAPVQETSVEIDDLTGTAAGWNVTIVASALTDRRDDIIVGTIPAANISLAASTGAPVSIAGSVAGLSGATAGPIGSPTVLASATAGNGVGDYSEAFSLGLTVPGNTPAAPNYTGLRNQIPHRKHPTTGKGLCALVTVTGTCA
jgi:hypothetical protein